MEVFIKRHNPYFNRWFSAMWLYVLHKKGHIRSHNPYFNRWFSAITVVSQENILTKEVTILILIDGFLQLYYQYVKNSEGK